MKVKYIPAGTLLNVNAVMCFKFKLRLKFINNKNYSFITVNFQVDAKNTQCVY